MAAIDNYEPRNWTDLLNDFNYMFEEVLYAELENCHKHYFREPTATETKIPPDVPLPIFQNNSKTSALLKSLLTKKMRVESPYTGIFRMDIEETFMSKLKPKLNFRRKTYFTEAVFDKCEFTYTFIRSCIPNLVYFVFARNHVMHYFLHLYRRLTYIKVFADHYMYMMNDPVDPAYFLREKFPNDFEHLDFDILAVKKKILNIQQQKNESFPLKLKNLFEVEIAFLNSIQNLLLKMTYAFVHRKRGESLRCQEFIREHFISGTYRALVRNVGKCVKGHEKEFVYLSVISNQIDLVTLLLYSSLGEDCIHMEKPTYQTVDYYVHPPEQENIRPLN